MVQPDAWWPEFGVAVEIDSHEWHMSPQDHTRTLERQRRMVKYGIVMLPFTPRQIRTERAEVLAAIRDTLQGARGRPPLDLRTIAVAA